MRSIIIYILVCCTIIGKAQSIPYPRPYPDSTALRFLPGIVSKDSFDFNSCFSPDGQSYYFTRSANRITKIFVTNFNGNAWSEPSMVSFGTPGFSEADPAFDKSGKLYFISNRPKNVADTIKDYDIWVISPLQNNSWAEPELLPEINSDSNEYYISFSQNGNLYFALSRPGGYGQEDIYVSRLSSGRFTKAVNLGPAVNSGKSEYDPGISPDENILVFASSGRSDGLGAADLYYSKADRQKKWSPAKNMGSLVNTNTREFCPYFPPDKKFFFFSSNGDVKWISLQFLTIN